MQDGTHSHKLWSRIRLAEPRLYSSAARFWTHPNLADMYPEFLLMLHAAMRSSVHLMETARDCALFRGQTDPVARETANYLSQHIAEEMYHDAWLVEDMVAMGMDRDFILNRVQPPAVASLVGAQYYWMFHAHPVALFGYLAVLEGNPPDVQQLEEIQVRTGLPAAGFRTLTKHAENDPNHIRELNTALDRMPLQDERISLLAISSFHTIDRLAEVFDTIVDSGQAPKKNVANCVSR